MATSPKMPLKATPLVTQADQAPFIYFDNVSTFGQLAGIAHIGLVAQVTVPMGEGDHDVKDRIVQVAHLRCSIPAAAMLHKILSNILGVADATPRVPTTKQ